MTTSLTITRLTITRPVFFGASLSFSALEAAWLAAPYGDTFVALAAEWQMRVEWENARIAAGSNFVRPLFVTRPYPLALNHSDSGVAG